VNITQLSYADVAGGAEQVASDLHRAYRDQGQNATLFVGTRHEDTLSDCYPLPHDRYRSPGAQRLVRKAPSVTAAQSSKSALLKRRTLYTLADPLQAARKALGYDDRSFPASHHILELTTAAPDVCHLHNPSHFFDLRALPALSRRVPLVITAHDLWMGTGRCAYPLDCQKWRTGCGNCPHRDYPPVAPFDRTRQAWRAKSALYNRSLLYLASPASWALRNLEQSIMAAGVQEARVIPNGVDQSIFHPAPQEDERRRLRERLGLRPDDFAIAYTALSVGNPYKDPETLSKALDLLAPSGSRITLIQMGAAEDSCARENTITRKTIAFSSRREDLAAVLQACDLYAHSARAEVAPLAILEAESCGLPVVASDVGGIRECVARDGEVREGALLAPASDPRALAEAIGRYLADPARTRAIGAEVARWAAGRFSHLRMAERYLSYYEEAQRSFAQRRVRQGVQIAGGY